MREGSSIAATKVSAVSWPTPRSVASRVSMGRKSLRSAAFRGRVPVGEINRFFAILQPGFSATRRSICSFADAVVPRRAMQAGVEVEVGFVGRVRPGAKDGSEVAAGSHAESVDEVARCPLILMLHKDAAVVGQKKAAMSTAFPLACSLGTAPGLS